jgi:dTDP-4-dehydrorhamnose 3,5-epimerase
MRVEHTPIEGLMIVHKSFKDDSRGRFGELYKSSEFIANGITELFVQDNTSFSHKGVLRGLHYQRPPYDQGKLVYCLSGCIYDVAVDLRPGPSYLKHYAVYLTPDCPGIFIPKGFAHGFMAYEPSMIMYKCTAEYAPSHEAGIRWDDPVLGINWPKGDKRVSGKDQALPYLKDRK